MKAVHQNERCLVVETKADEVVLEFWSHDHRITVKLSDPQLNLDPTDEDWDRAI